MRPSRYQPLAGRVAIGQDAATQEETIKLAGTLSVHAFIRKWRAVELKERSAVQEHFIDLCHVLGEPTPAAVAVSITPAAPAGACPDLEAMRGRLPSAIARLIR